MMIGPNSSGRVAAAIRICQPAWQLPITTGLPSASGCSSATRSRNAGLGAQHVLDRLAGHRVGQEADEVAGVAGPQRHADLAVGLEAADAGPVAGARVDDHEGPLPRVDRDARGRA